MRCEKCLVEGLDHYIAHKGRIYCPKCRKKPLTEKQFSELYKKWVRIYRKRDIDTHEKMEAKKWMIV